MVIEIGYDVLNFTLKSDMFQRADEKLKNQLEIYYKYHGLNVHSRDIVWLVNFQVGHPLLQTRCEGTESEHHQGPHPAGSGLY